MANYVFLLPFLVALLFTSAQCRAPFLNDAPLRTYIVHVQWADGMTFSSHEELEGWYKSFLPSSGQSRIVYSYGEVIRGFAAMLTEDEAAALAMADGVTSIYQERVLPLLTTHSPEFLGLTDPTNSLTSPKTTTGAYGDGVIVGMLDTGVTPDHPSFNGDDMPPPPPKWKGQCNLPASLCNNKLIGFQTFGKSSAARAMGAASTNTTTSYDDIGHGTHTASTAAGAPVSDANMLGQANGTSDGIAPRAHLAIYQVCTLFSCRESDVLAGINAAVEDGVDVLSISLGAGSMPFSVDGIAIGAFRAAERGVFVSCAAGNDGPFPGTVTNEAPWILTVAASTIDRSFRTTVRLGDEQEFDGESIYQPRDFDPTTLLPLVMPDSRSVYCSEGSLDGVDVSGKVVICQSGGYVDGQEKASTVQKAGGVAMVLINDEIDGYSLMAENFSLPASVVTYADGIKIKSYVASTSDPMGTIVFKGTVMGVLPSPAVTSFSSRGPSMASPGILKPDVIGPGVDIIAAWPRVGDTRPEAALSKYSFNIISGTSMSTPHLSGIAARIRSEHPDWSPAAIRSAIMTTADVLGRDGNPISDEQRLPANLFAMGAGHVNPTKATDPGLVYDIDAKDYVAYMCKINYTDSQVSTVAGRKTKCAEVLKKADGELNYPSISVTLKANDSETVTVRRVATNVGLPRAYYTVQVEVPASVSVTVTPAVLEFTGEKKKVEYTVTFGSNGGPAKGYAEGQLRWVSGSHVGRSAISVTFA